MCTHGDFVVRFHSRKKDHGRAESMLIAAWGCGCTRAVKGSGLSAAAVAAGTRNATAKEPKCFIPTTPGLVPVMLGALRLSPATDGYGNVLPVGESVEVSVLFLHSDACQ